MGITYMDAKKLFRMDTRRTTYLIGLSPEGYVGHVYYGRRLKSEGNSYLLRMDERPFTPSVLERERRPFWISFPRSIPPEASEIIGRAVWTSGVRAAALDANSSSRTTGSSGANRAFRGFRLLSGRKERWRRWSLCAGMRF